MNFSIQKSESHTRIKVHSDKLDGTVAPELKSELILLSGNGERNILVDLSGCDSCDSSGMSALLLGNRLCSQVNGKFVLCGLSGRVSEMVGLADFGTHLTIADTLKEAVAFFE